MDRPRGWAFIDLAELGVNTPRSYAVTLARVVLLPLAFVALALAAIYAGAGRLLPQSGLPAAAFGIAFGAVIVAGLALAWSVARTHRRPWMSLVSPDLALDWRRIAIGAAVEAGLLAAFLLLAHPAALGKPSAGEATMTLPAAGLAMLLTPFQAASEEMLFRGYLTQALGRVLRSRVAIAVIVGIVFAALHLNAYGALTMPYLFTLSLIYSLVSLRDQRLELTIGAHAATNWFAIAAGYALGVSPAAAQLRWPALLLLILNGALFYAMTCLLVRLLRARPSPPGA